MPALAAAPIALILALMLALRWSAARAGLAGLALAAVLGPAFFGFGPASGGLAPAFAGVLAEGGFTAATILWILWPALALHHHQQRCGAIDALRAGMARIAPAPALQALAVGWFLALFFEGAAGFGTPVALAAPLLVGLGVPAVQAVVLALLGHAVGVAFGAIGTPVMAQAALTGLAPAEIAWRTAMLNVALGGLLMVFFVRVLAQAVPYATLAPWAGLAAAAFLLPSLWLAAVLGPELATLGAALAGALLFAAALRLHRVRAAAPARPAAGEAGMGIGRALWPYTLLVVLVLATRAVPAIAEPLREVALQWQWQGFSGRMPLLTHPGTLLLAALLLGALLQGGGVRGLGESLAQAARRLAPVTVALLAMLCLSRLMLHAGMIDALQRAAVQGLGPQWPLLSPAVGALGSFVTGSATASNVLFTSLQAQTAQALGLPLALMVAAQGFGAGVGNIVCPHNIVAGAATVGLAGREAEILRRTVWPCAIYLLLGGALVMLLARGLFQGG